MRAIEGLKRESSREPQRGLQLSIEREKPCPHGAYGLNECRTSDYLSSCRCSFSMHLHTSQKSLQNMVDCIGIWEEALRVVAHYFHKSIHNSTELQHIGSCFFQNKAFYRFQVYFQSCLLFLVPLEVQTGCLYNSHHLRIKHFRLGRDFGPNGTGDFGLGLGLDNFLNVIDMYLL